MKIYTRTGDRGLTGLFGGPRVSKTDARIEAYGTVDELNAAIGLARSFLSHDAASSMDTLLEEIQGRLLVLGADLATPTDATVDVPRVLPEFATQLEAQIDELEEDLPALTNFILPGGSQAAAATHVARTVCRRAERLVAALLEQNVVEREPLIFLNRLSDFLFVAARWINWKENVDELTWSGS